MRGCDWGVKTGNGLTVIDFDSETAYHKFISDNAGRLPSDIPTVKTGRGYHLWIRTASPVKTQHFHEVDIKSEGGFVVVPPSFHKNGNQYRFIKPWSQEIPTLDLNTLILPLIKSDYAAKAGTSFKPREWKPVPGNMVDLINNGAEEGYRHDVLVRYLCALIGRGLSKELVSETAVFWNEEKNRPPLPNGEVLTTIESCWATYAPRVPIKTLYKDNSVLNGTRPEKRKSPEEHKKFIADLMAQTEANEPPHADLCGRKHMVMRKGRQYLSVSFFCGRWDCPRCAAHFKLRWIENLLETTSGQPLYIVKTLDNDWARLRRALNRAGAEYIRITIGTEITLILNKPLAGSEPLPQDKLSERLKALIPDKAYSSPISTSRGWGLNKKTKDDDTQKEKYTLVTRTWLPVDIQQYVAQKLGAKLDGDTRWVSPEDEDAQLWENKFCDRLQAFEEDAWSETGKKNQSQEQWLDDFQRNVEANEVYDGVSGICAILAG